MARILIVNDDEDLVETVALVLEGAGHDVARTLDGKAAVTIAREQRPDVVLLDFMLSGTNGGAVLAALRSDLVTCGSPSL